MMEGFSTLMSMAMVLAAAFAGYSKYRQAHRDTVASGMEDLARIAEAKDAVIETLERDLERLEKKSQDLTEQVGRVQGYNEALLREKFLLEQYVLVLAAELRSAGRPIPPRTRSL
jgi:septal ring factor EnvC (AmiA/AmiB activator)